MPLDIGAASVLGIALEVTPGTYVAPAKFVPFESESVNQVQDTNWRRPIRNTPGLVGAVAGNANTEGDLSFEALHDCVPYFLMASRCTFTKVGASTPFTYTFTPAPIAIPTKTASITIRRGSVEVFGYVGCIVSKFSFEIDSSGKMMFNCSVIGTSEASAAALSSITWPVSVPFGAGQYSVQIPTATQVFDTDTFSFESEDNGEAQFRLKTTPGAQFVKFGESAATLKVERDFLTRAEYDNFKALTAQTVTLAASQGANGSITILMPVAYKDTYEIGIGGQGDLIRASVTYQCAIDATGKHYTITVITTENIT